jgi:hypothetical protein
MLHHDAMNIRIMAVIVAAERLLSQIAYFE